MLNRFLYVIVNALLSAFLLLVIGHLGALGLAGTGAASAINVQAVVVGVEGVEPAGVHERREVGVTHLLHLATCRANQVGVGHRDALILSLHALKDMTAQHLGVDQQFHGVIDRGAAHAEPLAINHLLQLLDGEMPVDVHDAVQDGIALGGAAHTMRVKILVELAHNGVIAAGKIFDIWIGSHRCDKGTTNFAIEQKYLSRKCYTCFACRGIALPLTTSSLAAAGQHLLHAQLAHGIDGHVAQLVDRLDTQCGGYANHSGT